jgi:hypothetical protein
VLINFQQLFVKSAIRLFVKQVGISKGKMIPLTFILSHQGRGKKQ